MTSNLLRFVLDTSVIVSALLLPRSVPRQAFDLAFIQGTVLVSDTTLNAHSLLTCVSNSRVISQHDGITKAIASRGSLSANNGFVINGIGCVAVN